MKYIKIVLHYFTKILQKVYGIFIIDYAVILVYSIYRLENRNNFLFTNKFCHKNGEKFVTAYSQWRRTI